MPSSRTDPATDRAPVPAGVRRADFRFALDRLLLVMTVFSCIAVAIAYWVRFFATGGHNPMGAVLFTLAAPSFLLLAVAATQIVWRFVSRRR